MIPTVSARSEITWRTVNVGPNKSVVVLPTYNEAANIERFLRAVRAASDIDVLVVDDTSPDGTADIARSLADELGGIRVLQRASKDGLGSAYRAGFAAALDDGYETIVSMDADLSHDPAVISSMVSQIDDGADSVIGSRYVPGGGTENWPIHRRLLSRWGNGYTRWVLGLGVADCTSGFRAYRADALRAIDPGSTGAEGYAFLTELVRRLDQHEFSIAETPIIFRDRTAGRSKMSAKIIMESMMLVTGWGLGDRLRRWRPGGGRIRSTASVLDSSEHQSADIAASDVESPPAETTRPRSARLD